MRILSALLSVTLLVACTTVATPPPDTAPQPTATTSAPVPEPTASAQPTATAPTAAPTATTAPTATAPEGATCKGQVDPPPAGLEPVTEPAPSFSIGAPGKGALCEGKVFTVKQSVTVYRVFTAKFETAKKAGPTGAYWTFQKPSGNRESYRSTYEICTEWNDLDMLNECKIEVGAKVVLGPGQSADCDSGTKYPQSTANQVLIVKGADGKVPVLDCKQTPMKWAN